MQNIKDEYLQDALKYNKLINSPIRTILLPNVFDTSTREIQEYDYTNILLGNLLKNDLGIEDADNYTIIINDRIADATDVMLYNVTKGDIITITPKIEGGDNSMLRTVLMVVVAVVATYFTGGAGGAAWASASYGGISAGAWAGMAVMIAGSLLVNALVPLKIDQPSGMENDWGKDSPTYGWSKTRNSIDEGVTLPVLYGKLRITPPIIGNYVTNDGESQYLHVLYALTEGTIPDVDAITGIEINDNPLENYTEVETEIRVGSNRQSIIPWFDDSITDTPVNTRIASQVSVEPVTETPALNVTYPIPEPPNLTEYTTMTFTINFPNGLYTATPIVYYSDTGGGNYGLGGGYGFSGGGNSPSNSPGDAEGGMTT